MTKQRVVLSGVDWMVTKLTAAVETHSVVTEFMKTMIKVSENPRQVWTGIHNAFVHGDIFEDINADISDTQLTEMYKHIDAIGKILDKVE